MMTPPFCRPTRYYTDALRIIPPQRPYAELLRPFMARSITGGGSKRLNTRIERANVARVARNGAPDRGLAEVFRRILGTADSGLHCYCPMRPRGAYLLPRRPLAQALVCP